MDTEFSSARIYFEIRVSLVRRIVLTVKPVYVFVFSFSTFAHVEPRRAPRVLLMGVGRHFLSRLN